jgi:hypothetical protein
MYDKNVKMVFLLQETITEGTASCSVPEDPVAKFENQ